MEKKMAFPVEKLKFLSKEEKQLLREYKQKEKEASTAIHKMYYTGKINAVYDLAEIVYKERLTSALMEETIQTLVGNRPSSKAE
ncbi:hypothetical protein [Aquibacillus salsiterrae]|uniref:Uncharacterized protein n=1 Tax=Aquibacillus salsiterrae TaxID=2950439 RepID=A0A9X4AGZ9_9BACI|nr:hypothetical protein [Aquibacillus salsiterrae]MDC3417653.1 hypothetical protein [Aquibacillus salsiterrae]